MNGSANVIQNEIEQVTSYRLYLSFGWLSNLVESLIFAHIHLCLV